MIFSTVLARVTNPAIDPNLGGAAADPAAVFGQFISSWWGTMYVAGGIAFILYLAWGGIEWTIAGGNEDRVKNAKEKIQNAMFGLALLAGSFAIVKLISYLFGMDLFKIDLSKLAP